MPIKQIASRIGVSPSSVHTWCADIELTPEQTKANLRGQPNKILIEGRSRKAREARRAYQRWGQKCVLDQSPLHLAGCMLYWAEGTKSRNRLAFANSDREMMALFGRFLRQSLGVRAEDFRIQLNVYLNNGLSLEEVEDHWLEALEAPRSCLRSHVINHLPTSSSGRKRSLPYGVCDLRVAKSTWLVQHIYGAIQDYGGFEEPAWLDCATTPEAN